MKLRSLLNFALFALITVNCTEEKEETLPTLSTIEVEIALRNSIKCKATIESEGSASITESGFCWSTEENPTIEDSITVSTSTAKIKATIEGLTAETNYYIKAFAKSSAGIAYSQQTEVTTLFKLQTGTVTDIDGHTYKTVLIKNDWWMAENLKTTHYRNGDVIPNIESKETWMNPTEGYRCYYGNDSTSFAGIYGALYNHLVASDERGVCPTAWHIPSFTEWAEVIDMALQEPAHMIDPESDWQFLTGNETNLTGFNALGAGYRDAGGNYGKLNVFAEWWTSDTIAFRTYGSIFLTVDTYHEDDFYHSYGKSIRCIKDK